MPTPAITRKGGGKGKPVAGKGKGKLKSLATAPLAAVGIIGRVQAESTSLALEAQESQLALRDTSVEESEAGGGSDLHEALAARPPAPHQAKKRQRRALCGRCDEDISGHQPGVPEGVNACSRCYGGYPAYQAFGYSWEQICGSCAEDPPRISLNGVSRFLGWRGLKFWVWVPLGMSSRGWGELGGWGTVARGWTKTHCPLTFITTPTCIGHQAEGHCKASLYGPKLRV